MTCRSSQKESWDTNGGRDTREWNLESSDSDRPNPPHRPYFDDSEDSDAFEDYGPREHRRKGKPNKATTVTLTETELSPTTLHCRDCQPRQKTVKVTKTVADLEVITIESICTKTETETQYYRVLVPCHRHPCPQKPDTTTITKFFPKTVPYPCLTTKEVTITTNAPHVCTYTETRFKFHEQPQIHCHRRPCAPKTVTETLVETVTSACITTKHVPVPTTIPIIKPIIKPIPVKCTVTELETDSRDGNMSSKTLSSKDSHKSRHSYKGSTMRR